jgi:hypothetical protein
MSDITVFDVINEEVAVLPSFLKLLLEFSGYDSFISIAKMERHDFTDIESACRSMNIESFANSDFYKYYTTNEDFILKSGHMVLLEEVVEEIKKVTPKVFNGMLLKKLAERERRAPPTQMINKINKPKQVHIMNNN